ncbi:hypothetical protein PS2_034980 [Malus domestica]
MWLIRWVWHSSAVKTVDEGKSMSSFGRKTVSFILITTIGGVALSALNDLVIYQSCSSKMRPFYWRLVWSYPEQWHHLGLSMQFLRTEPSPTLRPRALLEPKLHSVSPCEAGQAIVQKAQ